MHSVLEKLTPSMRQMSYSNFKQSLVLFFSLHNFWTLYIWKNCKIYFCQHLYFISYKWADAHCWFCTWYLCLLVSIWVEVHRLILECNKISIFVSGHIFELRNNLWLMNWWLWIRSLVLGWASSTCNVSIKRYSYSVTRTI